MRKLILSIPFLTICFSIWSQVDPEATELLNQVSEKMQTSDAWQIDFTYIIENQKDESKYDQEGSIKLKEDKYILDLLGNTIYFDGIKNYNYIKGANEVNIMPPEDQTDGMFFTRPSNIFTFYKEGFKSRYNKDASLNGIKCKGVSLFPNDLDKSYFKIEILIGIGDNMIKSIKVFNKDGVTHQILLKNTQAIEMKDTAFTFDSTNYPNVEIIDLTE